MSHRYDNNVKSARYPSWEDVKLSRGPARQGSNPGPAERHLSSLYELLGRVRLGFLVVFPFRIACVFLHVEPRRSSKRVWRRPRVTYYFIISVSPVLPQSPYH
jgi:hypothetical protein